MFGTKLNRKFNAKLEGEEMFKKQFCRPPFGDGHPDNCKATN